MTHDRCSELLGSYVRGELPPDGARAVAAHLEECGECRAEERAVAALANGPEVAALTDVERARLHRGLAQELFKPRANADVAGVAPAAQRWGRWVAPALASAAVIAAIVVMTTGGGSDQTAESSGASVEAEDRTVEDSLESQAGGGGGAAQGGAPPAKAGKSDKTRALAGAESLDLASNDPAPAFYADHGELSRPTLIDLGNFRSFAGSYSPEDGPELYGPFLDQIKRKAGDVTPEIDECAGTLPQDGSLIPVYGVVGEYDDRDALALGFVTNDPGSEKLDRYLIWVWARAECGQPIDTFFEHIGAP